MLRPATTQMLNNESCYSFVIAVAKRARDIVDEAQTDAILLEENPVTTAVDEFTGGKLKMVEDPSLRNFYNK